MKHKQVNIAWRNPVTSDGWSTDLFDTLEIVCYSPRESARHPGHLENRSHEYRGLS
jgi:hypothetical protein